MKIIGLTGMSGAGKTTVCEEFSRAGFEIIDCDKAARTLTEKGSPALEMIARQFGNEYILPDGTLHRKALGKLVFSDKASLDKLNGIMYPYITYEVISRINKSRFEYILLDAPTLFESGIDYICGDTVCVVCDTDNAVQRIMKRDGLDRKSALDRLSSQHDENYYREKCDYVIENNADIAALKNSAYDTAIRIRAKA